MIIRQATESDVPAIVQLLKLSLGEDLLPKSETFWNWKHNQNPFGKSSVLLMEDSEKLVGVRAFMQWKWVKKNKQFNALRAVDTATHPHYQGKGIFKKLTLQLVEESKKTGFDFIYNTPNSSSMPGYLKMGWMTNGKSKIRILPSTSMILTRTGIIKSSINENKLVDYDVNDVFMHTNELNELIDIKRSSGNLYLETDISLEYLKWRYESVPAPAYCCLHDLNDRKSYCIFIRPKQTKFGIEGRITDVLINFDKFSETDFVHRFRMLRNNFNYISVVSQRKEVSVLLNKLFFLPGLSIGPTVTTRNLNLENSEFLLNFTSWKATLGDLELF